MTRNITEQIAVRTWQPTDLEQAVVLNRDASISTGMGPETGDWTTDLVDVSETFLENGGDFKVGTRGEHLVVMGGFKRLSETNAEIKRMRVTPALQGQGVGRWFLGLLENEIQQAGFQTIDLSTTSGQEGAVRLYAGSGYTETERVLDDGLVVVFFKKHLKH